MQTQAQSFTAAEIHEHYAWVKRMAYSLVRDPDVAGDLAQEAWLVALESPAAPGRDVRAWLGGVLRKKALHMWRGERRRKHNEERSAKATPLAPSSDELLASSELTTVITEEVQHLDEPFRRTLLLAAMSGLSAAEIADQESVPAATVRWRLMQGRRLLAERLDARLGERREWMRGIAALLVPRLLTVAATSSPFVVPGLIAAGLALLLVPIAMYILRPASAPGQAASLPAVSALLEPTSASTSEPLTPPTLPTSPQESSQEDSREAITTVKSPSRAARVTLDPDQAEVHIRLIDASGAPINRASFELPGDHGGFTSTNKWGAAQLRFRPPGNSVVMHFLIGGESGLLQRSLDVRVHAGEVTDVGDVVLLASQRLHGRVVDQEGHAVPNASVFVTPSESNESSLVLRRDGPLPWRDYPNMAASTDSSGRFELTAPATDLEVWAGSPSSYYASAEPSDDGSVQLVLESLPESSEVRGRVLDKSGAAVPGALVRGTRADHEELALRLAGLPAKLAWRVKPNEVEADANGNFALPCRSSAPLLLRVRDPQDRWEDLEVKTQPGTWDLKLHFEREL